MAVCIVTPLCTSCRAVSPHGSEPGFSKNAVVDRREAKLGRAMSATQIYFNPWDPDFYAKPYPHYAPLQTRRRRVVWQDFSPKTNPGDGSSGSRNHCVAARRGSAQGRV